MDVLNRIRTYKAKYGSILGQMGIKFFDMAFRSHYKIYYRKLLLIEDTHTNW